MIKYLFCFCALLAPVLAVADGGDCNSAGQSSVEGCLSSVSESYQFHGLASYYNNTGYYIVDVGGLRRMDEGDIATLSSGQWLASVGRLNVMLLRAEGISVLVNESKLMIENPDILSRVDATTRRVTKAQLADVAPELDQIRYAHLWAPLAGLAKLVESALVAIQSNISASWGLTIVIFGVLVKLLLLPVGIMTVRFQRRVSQVQAQLAPQLATIKANFDGEEAHNRLMEAHKAQGVSTFYTLKPILGSFVQIPILIAVFNALGEMPQLDNQSFLWIESLAYPDSVGVLPFALPMFGSAISLLPFIMTVVTLFSTLIFQNRHAPDAEIKRQTRNLYLMALAFFILFYPFPAAMVLYWVLANVLQTIQQQIVRI